MADTTDHDAYPAFTVAGPRARANQGPPYRFSTLSLCHANAPALGHSSCQRRLQKSPLRRFGCPRFAGDIVP